MEASVKGSLEAASVSIARTTKANGGRQAYSLERELHERRVVDLPDLIFGPVKARNLCIDSFLEDSALPGLRRRRSGSRSNGRECVIDDSAELASPWRWTGGRAEGDSSRKDGQRHGRVVKTGGSEVLDEWSRVGGHAGWEYHLHSTEVGLSNGLIKPMFSGRVADYDVLGGLGAGLTRLPDL